MTDEAATATIPAPAATPAAAAPVVEAPAPAAPVAVGDDVASLPEWAQKLLGKTRSEAASNRTKANDASTALDATRDAIAKALGLKGDDDPVAAAKMAADEREAARAVAKNLAVENAVLRMASRQGANPESLTDSRAFMRQLEAIDPESDDFATQVEAAITKAVEANPLLKAQAAPVAAPVRSGGPVGGGAAIPGQLTREDIQDMSPDAILKAKEDGQLNTLLGITP